MDGIWKGEIVRVVGVEVFVKVPRLAGDTVFGPCLIIEGLWTKDLKGEKLKAPGGTHTHPAEFWVGPDGPHEHQHEHKVHAKDKELRPKDPVLVGFLEGNTSAPVVLGRISTASAGT